MGYVQSEYNPRLEKGNEWKENKKKASPDDTLPPRWARREHGEEDGTRGTARPGRGNIRAAFEMRGCPLGEPTAIRPRERQASFLEPRRAKRFRGILGRTPRGPPAMKADVILRSCRVVDARYLPVYTPLCSRENPRRRGGRQAFRDQEAARDGIACSAGGAPEEHMVAYGAWCGSMLLKRGAGREDAGGTRMGERGDGRRGRRSIPSDSLWDRRGLNGTSSRPQKGGKKKKKKKIHN